MIGNNKIGICVVTYNRPDCLRALLNNLSNSSYTHDVELIISIDNSGIEDTFIMASNFEWQH